MQANKQRRPFDETGWYHAGIGGLILAGIGAITAVIMGFTNSADNTNIQNAREEIARLEECGEIDDEALKAFCITGDK